MKHLFPLILAGACTLLPVTTTHGQQRYLVSPNDEIVRLNPGDDAQRVIRQRARPSETQVCSDKFHFGYEPWWFDEYIRAKNGDVIGEWFVAKTTGTIDTIFWPMHNDVAADSTVYIRVHRSYIGPDYGPGIRPGPWDPPCQQWGYWINTNNPDGGITAFPEWATDTTWQSTIVGSPVPSTPPLGEQLWGSTGYPFRVTPSEINFVPMAELSGPIPVDMGDKFFISFETPRGDTSWSSFDVQGYLVTTADVDYPSRLWKYYAHGGQSLACGTIPPESLKSGWMARGGFAADSTNVAVLSVWYAMTATANVPPVIVDNPDLRSTFDPAPRPVTAVIEDCNPVDPPNAGVAGAVIRYSVNGAAMPDLPLVDAGADVFTSTIPGQPAGTSVSYQVVAWDFNGDTGRSPAGMYTVIPFGTEWYRIDTGYACVARDISTSGAEIDTGAFFVPAFPGSGTEPKDDGTAGPIDMGDWYMLFGKPFRYAWVGVNGALALGASPTDTQDVNANGRWIPPGTSTPWTIPGPSKDGRGDSATAARMPEVYIAPLGAEHILGDSAGQYGRILTGNNGDSCLFIVQWDSVGAFADIGPLVDITTFRAILNRCNGSIEFQYESVGTTGLDSTNLTGMQISPELAGTPGPGYVTVNHLGYPIETRPFDGYCVRFFPAAGMVVDDGWSLVSLPVVPKNGDFRTAVLFPELDSRMYSYPYGGPPPDTVKPGTGYWVKSDSTVKIGHVPGTLFHELSAPVRDGWNIVGGTSGAVSTGSIVPTGTTIASLFFGYGSGGYASASVLQPGDGYWVKVTGDGTLGMNSWGAAPAAARPGLVDAADVAAFEAITFHDARGRSQTLYLAGAEHFRKDPGLFELPPPPPGSTFDVRFSSGRWVETMPGDVDPTGDRAIAMRGTAYPVTVRWDLRKAAPGGARLILALPGNGRVISMEGTGSTVLHDPVEGLLTISSAGVASAPLRYRLGPNYPNPFNPSTVIGFSIAKAGPVSLRVFNAIGEEVGTLIDGELPAGEHSAAWRPAGLPSGIYFCRLTAGEFSDTRKLVLMK